MQRRDARRVAARARVARHTWLSHACDLATEVSRLFTFEREHSIVHTFLLEKRFWHTLHVTLCIHEMFRWKRIRTMPGRGTQAYELVQLSTHERTKDKGRAKGTAERLPLV